MTQEQLQFIAGELKEVGFSTAVRDNSVIVGLKRFVHTNEVREELRQLFGEIEFFINRIDSEKVKVS